MRSVSDVTFVIVQHGEKRAGSTDPGLTDRGRRQATACADLLAKRPVVAIYTSPLRRAVETAHTDWWNRRAPGDARRSVA